jgi:hypothetical protein
MIDAPGSGRLRTMREIKQEGERVAVAIMVGAAARGAANEAA